ncbi:hypothetical protein R1flu_004198 [Riccia fluitans]|uniref:Uncharacterized protein n=1 Tax=Riccia fluitans TaxID=41844 RepID=A0ABD1YPK5_9MARC
MWCAETEEKPGAFTRVRRATGGANVDLLTESIQHGEYDQTHNHYHEQGKAIDMCEAENISHHGRGQPQPKDDKLCTMEQPDELDQQNVHKKYLMRHLTDYKC